MSLICQVIITEEDGRILASDYSTHVASHGATLQEAMDNLKEALELYYEDMSNEEIMLSRQHSYLTTLEVAV